jgi:Protein kinase domain
MSAVRPDRPDSLAVAQEVDALCDRYEEALRRGTAGALDDWLPTGATRAAALVELVRLELEQRQRAGEAVRAEDYFLRYPELRADAAAAARLAAAAERHARPTNTQLETQPASPGSIALPAQFGRYRIVKILGQGGMGTVYQAHDTQLERPVALKVMRLSADDPALVERFYREARIAASFTDPHLCPVYDVGQRDGVHYLTMPLLCGELLSAYLQRHSRLAEAEAVRLTALIARAVHAAHKAGVVHRDLKPANIMLNERCEPVVMDFGLARRYGPLDPRTTAPGALIGTPAYMSPEQIGGDSEGSGPAQDVYSLGVILYEMMTGRPPFDGSTSDVLMKTLTSEPVPPSRLRPGLDPRLERSCLTALAKKPADRFPSMEAFAKSLEMRGRQEQLTPAETRRGGRRVWVTGLLLAVAALGLSGGWFAWSQFGNGAAAPSASGGTMPGTKLSVEPTVDRFQTGSEWVGTFCWKGDNYNRKLVIAIKSRTANRFSGTYDDDNGAYRWEIEGTVQGDKVQWKFTNILHENVPLQVVGFGIVNGTLNGDQLTAKFHNDKALNGNTDAAIKLTRSP